MSIEHILGYIGWLWSDAMNNRAAFTKAHKWVKAERAQYVWSSSDPITIVVMTLFETEADKK